MDSPQTGGSNQGRVFLGTAVTSGTSWSFAGTFTLGNRITATATSNTTPKNTSPFSVAAIVNSITTSTISPSTYCVGAAVSVPYTTGGTFNTGNVFTAELSDAWGSFASPTNIGTLTSTTAGTIAATIPNVTAGTAYRIRVVGSTPVIIGTDNGTNLTLNPVGGGAGTWTWTGAVSTDWFDCRNWDKHCLPDLNSDVSVPATVNKPTIIGGAAACKSVSIDTDSGGIITVDTDGGGVLNLND